MLYFISLTVNLKLRFDKFFMQFLMISLIKFKKEISPKYKPKNEIKLNDLTFNMIAYYIQIFFILEYV